MAWSEIKYALNSSLGTSSFESLDKKLDRIEKIVDGQRRLLAASEIYAYILTGTTLTLSSSFLQAKNFVTINMAGTVRIHTNGTNPHQIEVRNAAGIVLASGTSVQTGAYSTNVNVTVEKGDELHIWLKRTTTSTTTVNLISVNAVIADTSGVTITPVCLTGDTLIRMADGTDKRIDTLSVGERVLSFNPKTMRLEPDEITYTDSAENKSFTEYDIWRFSDGTEIKTVHRHRFYNVNRGKMVYMDEWRIGDKGYRLDGEKITLESHENVKADIKHYTLFTKNQNYFANGALSGNRHTPPLDIKQ